MKLTTEPKTARDGSMFDAVLGVDEFLHTLIGGDAGRAMPDRYDKHVQTQLLAIAAVIEWIAGVAFVLFPAFTIALLLGVEAGSAGLMIACVAGVALLALGVACAGASMDDAGPARTATVIAITLYNAGAGLLLIAFAARGMAEGPVVWVAGVLHLGLAAAFAICGLPGPDARVESSPRATGRP